LRGQVEAIYGAQFEWRYLEEGPAEFRLQFTRRAVAPASWKRPVDRSSGLPMAAPVTGANSEAAPVLVDLPATCAAASHLGPQWSYECEDLNLTLLLWENGKRIEPHVNSEVDVVVIGVEGTGLVTVDGATYEIHPGAALLIPKGCERAIECTSARFGYISIHRRRRGLMPTLDGRPIG
jgi:mannose-6-phosphate isomerase-like protein (cupin superfamily)